MMLDVLKNHYDELVAIARETLHRSYPSRSPEELMDDLPAFLDWVAEALETDAVSPPVDVASIITVDRVTRHAVQRAQQGFDITRVARDYGLLCDAITTLAQARDVPITTREAQILNQCVDEATGASLEAFAKEQGAANTERAVEIGALAHEIRNSVSSATMAFSLIRSGHAPASGRVGAMLERSHDRIAGLVAQALVEARLAAGAVAERRNVDVAHLLQDLVAGLPVKEGKTIATEVEAGLELMADESLLYSALSNLLQNALKYSHPHEPILVRARREDDAVYFEIEDRCGGLPPGKAEELFAPFQQLPGTASGSGLGLTIARRAIEAHGGRIWVTNLPGVGCVFTAELPREVHAVVSAPALHRVPSR